MTGRNLNVARSLGGPVGQFAFHARWRAFCVAGPERQSGGPATRPDGGVSGPFRAALKTYRKFEQDQQPTGSRHRQPTLSYSAGCVTWRASVDA
jgi:hypothetical protein